MSRRLCRVAAAVLFVAAPLMLAVRAEEITPVAGRALSVGIEVDRHAARVISFTAKDRPYVAPPGIPADRHQALRRAFDNAARDPAFLAEAGRLQLELNPVSGEEIDALITRTYGASENAVRLATDALRNTDPANGTR